MTWHKSAFFTSLSLWVVAVMFVAPESSAQEPGRHPSPCSWRSAAVTLFCAAIMSVGYCKLRLYLDEMSDALAAARTGLDPYHVDSAAAKSAGFAVTNSDEVTVTRALLNCHDRTTDYLASYSSDMIELEEKFRASVRMLIEDIGSWNNEIAMIVREMRVSVSPAPPPFPAAVSNQAPSADDSAWSQRALSGASSPSGALPRGDSRGMLVTKNRHPNKSASASTSSTRTARQSAPVGADLEVDAAAVREVPGGSDASPSRSDGGRAAGRGGVRRADPARENAMLNVRRRTANTRDTDSPPEPHTFDNPRPPAAAKARTELEDAAEHRGQRSSGGTTPSDAEDPHGPSDGDEPLQRDAATPRPKEEDATPHRAPQLRGEDEVLPAEDGGPDRARNGRP